MQSTKMMWAVDEKHSYIYVYYMYSVATYVAAQGRIIIEHTYIRTLSHYFNVVTGHLQHLWVTS